MMRMLLVRAWCPRYRPTESFGCVPLATALLPLVGSRRSNELLPSMSRTSHLPIHRRYPQMEWDSTIFPTCASRANLSVRVCLFTSLMADSATPFVACSQNGLSRKTNSTNEDANKVAFLRATIDGSPSLCNIALRYPSRRNRDTNHDVAYSLLPLADRLLHTFQFSHLSQPGRAVCFVSFHHRRRHRLPCNQASNKHDQSQQVRPRPLNQAPVSRVFKRCHVLTFTHHTKFDAGHVQTQHGVQLPAWSVHVQSQQRWVAEPLSVHHECLHPQSRFQLA